MPQLGESIAEATIIAINDPVGSQVEADQEILEVETNKATMGITSPCAGLIAELSAVVDRSYAVGAILGYLEVTAEEAERAGIAPAPEEPARSSGAAAEQRPPSIDAPPATSAGSAAVAAGSHFRHDEAAVSNEPAVAARVEPTVGGLPVPANATGASYISPRLRARMHELGINSADLAGVPGSGSGGRGTVEDFERFMASLEDQRMTPASPMRSAVADSMRRSWTRPLATVGTPVRIDAMLAHRKSSDPKPGPALYAIRALAIALAEDTSPAGRLIGVNVIHPPAIDIGFAVEVADGVLVPVLRDADKTPLKDLVDQYNDLVDLARNRRLPREASRPGIATVTNFGTFGIVWATPIPLPEQNLVFGLGMGRKQPRWDEASASFLPQTEAEMTLSFDHRLLDGGAAGRLLARVGALLQTPEDL
ncbi:dihydrolipoyllysine-residue acetyltransferase [soil metagenome]